MRRPPTGTTATTTTATTTGTTTGTRTARPSGPRRRRRGPAASRSLPARSEPTVQTDPAPPTRTPDVTWYALTPTDVARPLAVAPAVGLPAATAAERLRKKGPNALPEE